MSAVSYAELIAKIKELVEQGRTATMYIKTDDNRLVTVVLLDGEIDAVMFGSTRGTKALQCLMTTQGGSYRITEDGLRLPHGDLPATERVLALLSGSRDPAQVPSMATPQADTAGPALPYNAALAIVSERLSEYLGPIAEMIVQEALDAGTLPNELRDWTAMVKRLAREIPDQEEAKQFVEQATEGLKDLSPG